MTANRLDEFALCSNLWPAAQCIYCTTCQPDHLCLLCPLLDGGRHRANCRSCQTLKTETCIVLKFGIDKGLRSTDPARCHGCHLRVFKYYVSSGKGRSQVHFTIYHLYLLSLFQFFQEIPRYRDVLAFGAGVLQGRRVYTRTGKRLNCPQLRIVVPLVQNHRV